MDITIGNRDEYTKRFNFVRAADGDVSFDDTEAHAVITSAMEHKGTYAFDPTHGSEIHTLKSLTRRTPSQAEAMLLDAMQPLEVSRTIASATATATADRSSGRLTINHTWKTPSGNGGSNKQEI